MIGTDKYEETDHPELVEFEGETLGDTLTNLLAEVKRLREGIKQIARDYDFNAIKSQSRNCSRPAYDVPSGDGIHTVTFHQKACLKIMELVE
tara:strand:- start:127 stop:402 length:276 start_codon:yes stop_codon:yes gene_type:complete